MVNVVKASLIHIAQLVKLRIDILTELNVISSEQEKSIIEQETLTYFNQALQDDSFKSLHYKYVHRPNMT